MTESIRSLGRKFSSFFIKNKNHSEKNELDNDSNHHHHHILSLARAQSDRSINSLSDRTGGRDSPIFHDVGKRDNNNNNDDDISIDSLNGSDFVIHSSEYNSDGIYEIEYIVMVLLVFMHLMYIHNYMMEEMFMLLLLKLLIFLHCNYLEEKI